MRESRGLTREALAALALVSSSTLRSAEVTGIIPRRATRMCVAAALGVDPASIWPDPRGAA